jgi:thioredoxin
MGSRIVRTQAEFANGHIFGSGQLNYYTFDFSQKLLLLPKDQPIYLYCNTGWRSKRAAQILIESGYNQVYNLEKGIMEWELYDYPVIIEPNSKPSEVDKMEPDEFYALINSDIPVFIDFYAPWCAPCRKMMPLIDSIQTKYRDEIRVVKINVDASKRLVKQLKLSSVPYFSFYKNGAKLFEHFGLLNQSEIESVLGHKNKENF